MLAPDSAKNVLKESTSSRESQSSTNCEIIVRSIVQRTIILGTGSLKRDL